MSLARVCRMPFLTTLAIAVAVACTNGLVSPDGGSPRITVIFPSGSAYDRDGDGLLDLEISFVGSPEDIDLSSIEVASNTAVSGAQTSDNLLAIWTVHQMDSSGFRLEETPHRLLPRGSALLTIRLVDKNGELATKSVAVSGLPPAHFHKLIDLRAEHALATSDITINAQDNVAYVTTEEFGGTALSIVDLQTLTWRRTVRTQTRALSRSALDVDRQRLYLMSLEEPEVGVFDLGSESFLQPIPVSAPGIGVALSRQRSELYVGLAVGGDSNGFISVVDVARLIQTRVIDLNLQNLANPGLQLGMAQLALNETETRLYASTSPFAQQGVLEVDPISGMLVNHFDLRPEDPVFFGGGNDVDVLGNLVIATSTSESGLGRIAIVPVDRPLDMRFGFTGQFLTPKNLEITPDRTEWGVTIAGRGAGFHAVHLMDAVTLRTVWEHRISTTAVSPEDIAFVPAGNLFLVAGGSEDLLPAPSPSELYVFLRRAP